MAPKTITTPITLKDNELINAVDPNEGCSFLGFKLSYSDNIYKINRK